MLPSDLRLPPPCWLLVHSLQGFLELLGVFSPILSLPLSLQPQGAWQLP